MYLNIWKIKALLRLRYTKTLRIIYDHRNITFLIFDQFIDWETKKYNKKMQQMSQHKNRQIPKTLICQPNNFWRLVEYIGHRVGNDTGEMQCVKTNSLHSHGFLLLVVDITLVNIINLTNVSPETCLEKNHVRHGMWLHVVPYLFMLYVDSKTTKNFLILLKFLLFTNIHVHVHVFTIRSPVHIQLYILYPTY